MATLPDHSLPLRHPLRVRAPILLIFVVALTAALAVPIADLWMGWGTPVVAEITLDPPQPHAGQVSHLVVTLRGQSSALAGSTPLEVGLLMAGMDMGIPPLRVAALGNHYQTVLPFTMTGTWQIALGLHPPAHAPWAQTVQVQVHDGAITGWRVLPGGGSA